MMQEKVSAADCALFEAEAAGSSLLLLVCYLLYHYLFSSHKLYYLQINVS
jgi:hypothetical protein